MDTAMKDGSTQKARRQGGFVLVGVLVVMGVLAGTHLMMMRHIPLPAADDFGLGPRTSGAGLYTATLIPTEPLVPRKLQSVHVAIAGANGQPIPNARIAIDGGMPQHGHGLPTRPRVTKSDGNGVYEIDGVRFNMRGWWEFKLSVTGDAGTDLITFNLKL